MGDVTRRKCRWKALAVGLIRSALLLFALTPAFAACSEDPPATHLQPSDLELPKGFEDEEFDPDDIVEAAAFTDTSGIAPAAVQKFFAQTPYSGRPSFLETYLSNGIRAADAIALVSRQYRINPLVFLIYTQAVQGLIGERYYPIASPERVEYVFRCGCFKEKNCLPELAGYDRQLDCLGRALRHAVDEIQTNGKTAAGWGVDRESTTLDNRKVKPASVATAAIYDRTPRIEEGKPGGTWLLWNLWNHYAVALKYGGPIGTADGRWIGEPCTSADVCSTDIDHALCAVGDAYPGGFCTADCGVDRPCPLNASKTETFCTMFRGGDGDATYYCLPVCNAVAGTAACREGYQCKTRPGLDGAQRDVCESATP